MRPARSMRRWLMTSASAGSSREVEMKNCEIRMIDLSTAANTVYSTGVRLYRDGHESCPLAVARYDRRHRRRVYHRTLRCALAAYRQRYHPELDAPRAPQRSLTPLHAQHDGTPA